MSKSATDGTALLSSTFTYDGAGRLIKAVIPGHTPWSTGSHPRVGVG